MASIKRYAIPHSRMPFINAEVAKVQFRGDVHLVSSIWGGSSGGRIYFWNPDTGSRGMRELPEGIPGAYMLRTAADGCLYLGCGNGDLIRYDPVADRFEILVTGELTSITWGGCVTDRYAVWEASPGHVGVYDWRESRLVKVFRPIDTEYPTALYGHNVLEAPDGRVLLAIDVPQARLVLLNLETMSAESHTPENIRGVGSTTDAFFWDDRTLAVFVRGELHFMAYPGFELKQKIARAEHGGLGGKACIVDGRLHAYSAADGSLCVLDREAEKWEVAASDWSDGGPTTLHPWGETAVCGVTLSGLALKFDTETGQTDCSDLESTGPMAAHALCPVPEQEDDLSARRLSTSGSGSDRHGNGRRKGLRTRGAGRGTDQPDHLGADHAARAAEQLYDVVGNRIRSRGGPGLAPQPARTGQRATGRADETHGARARRAVRLDVHQSGVRASRWRPQPDRPADG